MARVRTFDLLGDAPAGLVAQVVGGRIEPGRTGFSGGGDAQGRIAWLAARLKALDFQPRRVLDYLTEAKNNGNNVDIEQEGMDSLNNQLIYTTLAQVISSEFQRVNIVLR